MYQEDSRQRPTQPGAFFLPGHRMEDEASIAMRLSRQEAEQGEQRYRDEIERAISRSLDDQKRSEFDTAITIDNTSNSSERTLELSVLPDRSSRRKRSNCCSGRVKVGLLAVATVAVLIPTILLFTKSPEVKEVPAPTSTEVSSVTPSPDKSEIQEREESW